MGGTVSIGMRYAPNNRRARSTRERRPAVKKIITVAKNRNEIFKQPQLTIGVDLGDRISHYCVVDETGNVILEQRVPTTPKGIQQVFSKISRCRIALETGTHSPWLSRLLTQLGHEVIVAHARNVQLITESSRKDDRLDARTLARLARIDPELLGPVRHRSAQAQIHLTGIRARATLVSARTALVNAARGLTKSYGERLPKCGTEQMNRQIAKEVYPEVVLLKQVKGVGTLIALAYVLTLDDAHRFRRSRDAGCFLGLRPGRRNSGMSEPQSTTQKEGTPFLR